MESAMHILDGLGTCVNRYLAEHYQLSTDSGTLPAIRQCGGCPHCRAHRLAARRGPAAGAADVRRRPRRGAPARAAAPGARGTAVRVDRRAPARRRAGTHRPPGQPRHHGPGGRGAMVAAAARDADRPGGRTRWRHGSSAADNLRVPTLVRVGGRGSPAGRWALLLDRLARGPLTVVLTDRDEPSPFGGPDTLLRESWGPSYPDRPHPAEAVDGTPQPTGHPARGDALPGAGPARHPGCSDSTGSLFVSLVAPRGLTEAMKPLDRRTPSRPECGPDDLKAGRHSSSPRLAGGLTTLGLVASRGRRSDHRNGRDSAPAGRNLRTPAPDRMSRVLLRRSLQMGEPDDRTDRRPAQAVVLLHTAGSLPLARSIDRSNPSWRRSRFRRRRRPKSARP